VVRYKAPQYQKKIFSYKSRKDFMNTTKRDLLISAVALTIVGCSTFSISSIVAGKSFSFGLSSIILPALASVGGIVGSLLATLFIVLKTSSGLLLITKGLPTIAALASAQAQSPSRSTMLLNIGLPIAMAAAFIAHPVGGSAWVYTLFWLVPIACEILRQRGDTSLFGRLLGATFIAHAVGSVIWLYTMPTSAATWMSLLTLVPAERLVFASGATLAAIAMLKVKGLLGKFFKKRFV
jgi:hypothetical protein